MPTNPTSKPYLPETFKAQFNAPMPDILYHYTGQNGLIGIAKDVMRVENLEKVLERLTTSEKTTIVIARELDGKMRVTSGSWDGELH